MLLSQSAEATISQRLLVYPSLRPKLSPVDSVSFLSELINFQHTLFIADFKGNYLRWLRTVSTELLAEFPSDPLLPANPSTFSILFASRIQYSAKNRALEMVAFRKMERIDERLHKFWFSEKERCRICEADIIIADFEVHIQKCNLIKQTETKLLQKSDNILALIRKLQTERIAYGLCRLHESSSATSIDSPTVGRRNSFSKPTLTKESKQIVEHTGNLMKSVRNYATMLSSDPLKRKEDLLVRTQVQELQKLLVDPHRQCQPQRLVGLLERLNHLIEERMVLIHELPHHKPEDCHRRETQPPSLIWTAILNDFRRNLLHDEGYQVSEMSEESPRNSSEESERKKRNRVLGSRKSLKLQLQHNSQMLNETLLSCKFRLMQKKKDDEKERKKRSSSENRIQGSEIDLCRSGSKILSIYIEADAPKTNETLMEENKDSLQRLSSIEDNLEKFQELVEVDFPRLTRSDPGIYFSNNSTLLGRTCFLHLENFDYLKLLGKGAFGEVFLVQRKSTHDLYALKVVHSEGGSKMKRIRALLQERDIFSILEGDFLVHSIATFVHGSLICFLMDFIPGGDLRALLNREEFFDEEDLKYYLPQIFLGLEQLHSKGIYHKDIKPENIMIDSDGSIKLTDFGLSEIKYEIDSINRNRMVCPVEECLARVGDYGSSPGSRPLIKNYLHKNNYIRIPGTPDYIAPELIQGKHSSRMVDYWAVGVLAYEALTTYLPFNTDTVEGVFKNILKGKMIWPSIGKKS